MAILDFSVSGWHGFGSITQGCFGISVSNSMCMSFVAVGRSLTIDSYVAFKMAALWFWTMFNCNPPIAHCHPLLWGGGILVDHWSTISSFEFILICEWRHSWKSETWLLTDKLDQVTLEVMACLTVKMMPIAEIYPYFPHTTWWKKTIHPLKLCEL